MAFKNLCGWLGHWASQKWLAGPWAQLKVAAKIKKWLHTCVQRVGVSRTLLVMDTDNITVLGPWPDLTLPAAARC